MKYIKIMLILMLIPLTNIKALEINSTNAVMYNLNDNAIVYDINKDEKVSIASLTKIMTVYVALEHINDLNETITITPKMLSSLNGTNAFVIGLKVGQKVTYNDLLYATFLPSGADAAVALTSTISGNQSYFIKLMNDKADELGLTELHFENVIGLDDEENYGTVNSIAKLLMEALKNEQFKKIFTTSSYTFNDNTKTVMSSVRTNALNYDINIDYIKGAKTGFTYKAGKCLASIALDEKNNIEYLLVTVGAPITSDNAYNILDASIIYNYYFDHYKYNTLVSNDNIITSIPINFTSKKYNIKVSDDIKYYTKDFNSDLIDIKYEGKKNISASTKPGTKIGTVKVYYDELLIDEAEIKSEKININFLDILTSTLGIVISSIIVLSIAVLTIIKYKKRKRLV